MAKKKSFDFAAVQQSVKQSAQEWLEELTVESRVRSFLDDKLKDLIFKLLGFNNIWGEWQINTINGHDQRSVAGVHIRDKCSEAVTTWLDRALNPIPPLPKAATKRLIAYYHEQLERYLQEAVDEKASEEAERLASEMIQNLVSEAKAEASIPESDDTEENEGQRLVAFIQAGDK